MGENICGDWIGVAEGRDRFGTVGETNQPLSFINCKAFLV
jgi:hypothetical protein